MYNPGYRGRIVDVRFFETNSRLAAVSDEFEKIAFLDRFCEIEVLPQAGEAWQCVVRGDSNRDNPKRGALFLKPLKLLVEEVVWRIEEQAETRVLNVYKPKVTLKVMFGKKEISSREWSPADKNGLQRDWPDWVQTGVVERFEAFDRANRRKSYSARMKELAELKKLIALPDARFQWVGSWLTNGEVWLPRERPVGSEWRDYPIPAIAEVYWPLFLAGLEGKELVELIPFRQQILSQGSRKEAALSERQAKVSALIAAHMWKGTQDCERISIGRNVIFVVGKLSGKSLYIVDNPGVGAIYIFSEYDRALELANGSLPRSHAIRYGITRVIHRSGWETRLAALLK